MDRERKYISLEFRTNIKIDLYDRLISPCFLDIEAILVSLYNNIIKKMMSVKQTSLK